MYFLYFHCGQQGGKHCQKPIHPALRQMSAAGRTQVPKFATESLDTNLD